MNRWLNVALIGMAALLCSCAANVSGVVGVQVGTVTTRTIQSREGLAIDATTIPIDNAGVAGYANAQFALGHVWASLPSLSGHKTLRIDPASGRAELRPRPFTIGMADLEVDEHALWHSDGRADGSIFMGKGDVYRVDPASNRITATIRAAGAPFAHGDGVIWAYHPRTRMVSGIDTRDNEIRHRFVVEAGKFVLHTYGAGSIWQFAYDGEVATWKRAWQLTWQRTHGGTPPEAKVRRIDPVSGRVLAEISLGPFVPTDPIRFVDGAIWLLGWRDASGTAYATRIDVATNQVVAVVPVTRDANCLGRVTLKTPVLWHEAIWISTGCSDLYLDYGTGFKQIDPATNRVADEIRWTEGGGHAALATGDGALWALHERLAVRFEQRD